MLWDFAKAEAKNQLGSLPGNVSALAFSRRR